MSGLSTPAFEWEIDFVAWLTERRSEFLEVYLNVFNFSGEELFFSIALPLIYWTMSKRIGLRLSLAVFLSIYVNGFFKDLFQASRPYNAHPDRIVPQYESHSYSFPSGHALETFTFWGFIASAKRQIWWYAAAAVIILHVAFAKMAAGVHYPSDILFGWLLAIVILLCSHAVIRFIERRRLTLEQIVAIALLVPAAMLALYHGVNGSGGLDVENAYQTSGLIAFMLLGYGWERERIRFSIPRSRLRRLGAFVIGIAGLLAIKEGVGALLPEAGWSDFLRYGLLGFWTVSVAPWLFIAIKLYGRAGEDGP